jgi:hypothetical protein
MNNSTEKCDTCGELLKPSQYARLKKEGQPASNVNDHLVCRNYPACEKAEKEILNGRGGSL